MNPVIQTLILQASSNATDIYDILILLIISIAIILVLGSSGKVNMGFQVPGFPRPLSKGRRKILNKYFSYYKKLPIDEKNKFEQKVQYFIYIKEFIPRKIPRVTEEMKVLIAACAVQLTFGYPKVFLAHFKRILVYPDNYYSTINNTHHKGEVNPRLRAIVLSWKSFVEGYIDLTDGRNLGLHEMAHALRLENNIFNGEHEFLDKHALEEWHQLATEEIKRIEIGESRMFRDYAGTNQEEFFSVAVENFFERPEKFKTQMPKLYQNLTLLLRQHPVD